MFANYRCPDTLHPSLSSLKCLLYNNIELKQTNSSVKHAFQVHLKYECSETEMSF